jgi:protein ImuB
MPALEGKAASQTWDPESPRPLRLFARPEPIEAIAEIPDNPPRQFHWRGRPHRVMRAEGPERIGEEGWRRPIEEVGPARVRDYYRVEDETGARYWLFRTGLYGADETRWYLHGLFG